MLISLKLADFFEGATYQEIQSGSTSALAFIFGIAAMASIGLPGLANFSGEVLVFLSAFRGYDGNSGLGPVQIACIISIWGVVISAVYMLRAYRKIFQGPVVRRTGTAAGSRGSGTLT